MPDFDTSVLENFADAAAGIRRTFVTRRHRNDSFVVRELMYSATNDIFIFAKTFSSDVFSTAVIRNLSMRRSSPSIRILLESGSDARVEEMALDEISDLVHPRGPIQIRKVSARAPMHLIVVDGKHVRIEPTQVDGETIVELNAPMDAKVALERLNEVWEMAQPVQLRTRQAEEARHRVVS
jgi:hypothetical protein